MASPLSKRRKARELAVQALYQWGMAGQNISAIEAQFYAENDPEKIDQDYFREALKTVTKNLDEIDALIEPYADRTLEELDPVSMALLRLGVFEFGHRLDVPFKVVINEGVNLAKRFGPTDSDKYINGVLDKIAPQMREAEVQAMRNPSEKKPVKKTPKKAVKISEKKSSKKGALASKAVAKKAAPKKTAAKKAPAKKSD